MKNVAILVVHFDTISRKYECDLTYLDKHDKVNNELYISSSNKVITELVKFGIGKEQIIELEQMKNSYLEQNHKSADDVKLNKFLGNVEEMKCNKCDAVTGHVIQNSAWCCTICDNKK